MLSNPTNALHDRHRQRQHRRQHSTPTAFEPVKIPSLTNIQRSNGHRRGISLDQNRRQNIPLDRMVSNINPGFSTTPQHVLQETQQQRLVRPGQAYAHFDSYEGYLSSPIVTPHRQSFDTDYSITFGDNIQQSPSYAPIDQNTSCMGSDPCNFNGNNDFNLFPLESGLTSSAFLEFCSSQRCNEPVAENDNFDRKSSASRRISVETLDGVSRFENLALQSPQRPITPSDDNVEGYLPPTPTDTPHLHMLRYGLMNSRFMNDYDTSMEETIKPGPHQRARGIFEDMRNELEKNLDPTPPLSDPVSEASSFDSVSMSMDNLSNPSALNLDFLKNQNQFEHEPSLPQNHADISPVSSGHEPSAKDREIPIFSDPFVDGLQFEARPMLYPESSIHSFGSLSPRHKTTNARSESLPTINLEESITETGITVDDIARFISGPDPTNGGKWMCMYPDCNKRFGRKENIKSHIQTHLGDRQFQCPFCKKCFVRQHDLKRHAKIHSGIKPYPCQCGNSFARHDALTRHRQRGMCIGAFEGVVKKVAKRGRPRKARSIEERLDKSSRTRKNKKMSVASSTSECSESDVTSPHSNLSNINNGFEYFPPITKPLSHLDYSLPHTSKTVPYFSQTSETQLSDDPRTLRLSTNAQLSFQSELPNDTINYANSNPASPSLRVSRHGSVSNEYSDPSMASESENKILSNVSEVPKVSTQENDLFFNSMGPVGRDSSRPHQSRENTYLMGKYVDPFSQPTGEEFYQNSADLFFGN